jgi:hypothetical protein
MQITTQQLFLRDAKLTSIMNLQKRRFKAKHPI